MHRYAHRLFDGRPPATTYSTDGAEMGKALVAEGLGIAILPDFSISADPLVVAGVITTRPIRGDATTVSLLMLRRRVEHVPHRCATSRSRSLRHAGSYRGRDRRRRARPSAEPFRPAASTASRPHLVSSNLIDMV